MIVFARSQATCFGAQPRLTPDHIATLNVAHAEFDEITNQLKQAGGDGLCGQVRTGSDIYYTIIAVTARPAPGA